MDISYESSVDPLERARLLERVHAAVLAGDRAPHEPRPVVFESWRRSLAAQIVPDFGEPPVSFDYGELDEVRQQHPLARWVPMLRQTLLDGAEGAGQVMIITDADGTILWREGHPAVRRDADRVHLAEGTRWAETAIGTNAMGTTLATGAPVQIHSAEHLVRTYHSWTCAACPIRDPETGALLGAIDLSGPLHTMHPALLALVVAAARIIENELRWRLLASDALFTQRNEHHLAEAGQGAALLSHTGRVVASAPTARVLPGQRVGLDDGGACLGEAELEPLDGGYLLRVGQRRSRRKPRLSLELLGSGTPAATVDGVRHELSLRHAEMLALLVMHPRGLTAERLALLLHGEQGNPTTVRVEIHRLRNVLGRHVVETKPYRITADVDADLLVLREALRRGDVEAAVERAGLLLPDSESAAVRAERDELLASMRGWVLGTGNPDLLWRFANTEAGRDDPEVLERARDLSAPDAPHRDVLETRLRLLLEEEA
ncbi:GAF domain-containing protein [Saccharopolyspora erythraea]|uniref:GAF domain-containing protein n=1 Tax=Saccharopolyspora erythraea TaxID=1836 RepID=UPI002013333B|nr:GAF domain-containing protein [Saccharopolyspora erythraea]